MKTVMRILWLVTFAGVASCSTPTLPLPPPTALTTAPDVEGEVTVSGESLPDAYVSCINERLEIGVIVRADEEGVYTLQIEAESGDSLLVWQNVADERGPPVELIVPEF